MISVDAGPVKTGVGPSRSAASPTICSATSTRTATSRATYGVMRDDGISERAIFLVDKTGHIVWAQEVPTFQNIRISTRSCGLCKRLRLETDSPARRRILTAQRAGGRRLARGSQSLACSYSAL